MTMTSPLLHPLALLVSLFVLLAMTGSTCATAVVREGDVCGVDSADFLSFEFLGDARVAGTVGCVAEDNATQTADCFCAPNLDNQERLSVRCCWCSGDGGGRGQTKRGTRLGDDDVNGMTVD
jgi:hypothetical protein